MSTVEFSAVPEPKSVQTEAEQPSVDIVEEMTVLSRFHEFYKSEMNSSRERTLSEYAESEIQLLFDTAKAMNSMGDKLGPGPCDEEELAQMDEQVQRLHMLVAHTQSCLERFVVALYNSDNIVTAKKLMDAIGTTFADILPDASG